MLYYEVFIWITFFLVMGILLISLFNIIPGKTNEFENSVPELSYNYPIALVKTFLLMEVDMKLIKDKGLPEKKYLVKDLIYLNTMESLEIVEIIRKDYLADLSSSGSTSGFILFSNYAINSYDMLKIKTNQVSIPDLEKEIKVNNYFFPIQLETKDYSLVYFLEPGYENRGEEFRYK